MATENANSIALVTGGSSGIGIEIARCFARDGCGLIIASTNRAKLSHAAEELDAAGAPNVDIVVADLASRTAPSSSIAPYATWRSVRTSSSATSSRRCI